MTAVGSPTTDRSQPFPAFAAAMERAYERAADRPRTLSLDCGGAGIALELASPPLADALTPALSRLPPAGDLPIVLRLQAFSEGEPPSLPWPLAPPAGGEATLRLGEHRFVVGGATPPTLMLADLAAKRAWYWIEDAARLSLAERAAPFLRLLAAALARRERWVVHGGAVADERRALLLVGRGGSGKSTSCLAALGTGLALLGDDYVLVDAAVSPPSVHALFSAAKADHASRQRLAAAGVDLPARFLEPAGKTLLDLGAEQVRWASRAPLAAIVLPRIAAETGEPVAVSAAAAMRALAPSSLFQLADQATQRFAACAVVSRAVPAFRLDVGPDLRTVGAALRRLLVDLPGSGAR